MANSDQQGDFVWYELMTTDADAAQKFYGPMLGWTFEEAAFDGNGYRAFKTDGAPIGGFVPLSEEMLAGGARPAWNGYIRVDRLEDALATLERLGGTRIMGPMDVPDIGPMAMVADPQGAPFTLIEDNSGNPSQAFARYEPKEGHCAWNELATSDQAGAHAFYTELLGWEKAETMDMGDMGAYDMYRNGDYTLGAIMAKPAEMPVSLWSYYFRVPNIDAAGEYVTENGGRTIAGPMEIPGGEFVFTGIDPQGAMFSLIGKKGT